jgi:cytosine/adenosine deaminase-related metal-dependent hydrolase
MLVILASIPSRLWQLNPYAEVGRENRLPTTVERRPYTPNLKIHDDGVLVFVGQDDISDPYYAFGRNNMLEVALLAAHTLWMSTRPEQEILYDMVTTLPARGIGLVDHELKVGAPANLVVLDQPNVTEALRFHNAPVGTISGGKVVDQDQMRRLGISG